MPKAITSALGAIPKPTSQKVCLIQDCSRPFGRAVHDKAENRPFSYQSMQQALTAINKGTWMAKLDFSCAYRLFRISEEDYEVTGLT